MSSNDPDPGRFDWDRHEREITSPDNPTPPDPDATAAVAERVADGERVLVDTPQAQRPARMTAGRLRAAQRRPIVPAMLRSRAELGESTRWAAGFVAHTSAYHLTRAPKYAGRLAFRAPRGGVRLLSGWLRWLFDLEGEPVRQATVNSQEPEVYLRLARQRDRRVRWRAILTVLLVCGALLCVAALALAPAWARAAACAALVAALGILGRPADRPLLDTAVVIPQAPRLTSDMVIRALSVLGLAGINQALARDPKAISFVAPSPATAGGAGAPTSTSRPASPSARSPTAATSSPPAWAGRWAVCGPKATPRSIPGGWCCSWATPTSPRPASQRGRWPRRAQWTCFARSRLAPTRAAARSP